MPAAPSLPSCEVHTIATLRDGEQVDGVFACTRKDRQLTRAGAPYLAVELRDRTGAMPARAFRDADVLAGRFQRGGLVRVRGRVARYRGELQVELSAIEAAEGADADPTRFLPAAYRDLDELEGFLEHLAREVCDPTLAQLLGALLDDPALRAEIRPGERRRATTPTSAACSSTPSQSPRWRWSCARCTSAWTATCC
jgi:3'-5' exoribonuclease